MIALDGQLCPVWHPDSALDTIGQNLDSIRQLVLAAILRSRRAEKIFKLERLSLKYLPAGAILWAETCIG